MEVGRALSFEFLSLLVSILLFLQDKYLLPFVHDLVAYSSSNSCPTLLVSFLLGCLV